MMGYIFLHIPLPHHHHFPYLKTDPSFHLLGEAIVRQEDRSLGFSFGTLTRVQKPKKRDDPFTKTYEPVLLWPPAVASYLLKWGGGSWNHKGANPTSPTLQLRHRQNLPCITELKRLSGWRLKFSISTWLSTAPSHHLPPPSNHLHQENILSISILLAPVLKGLYKQVWNKLAGRSEKNDITLDHRQNFGRD